MQATIKLAILLSKGVSASTCLVMMLLKDQDALA
jgi:hypothetical protein